MSGSPWSWGQLAWEAESLALNSQIKYCVIFGKSLNLSEPWVHPYKGMGV